MDAQYLISTLYSIKDSLQDEINLLEAINDKSGFDACEEYIKENDLEYIGDEIRKAFRYAFKIGRLQRNKNDDE